jgi:hypothetical protein
MENKTNINKAKKNRNSNTYTLKKIQKRDTFYILKNAVNNLRLSKFLNQKCSLEISSLQ